MFNKKFWLTVAEWVQDPSPTTRENNHLRGIHLSSNSATERARWFPIILHSVYYGAFSLFEIIAGSEDDLGPNQKELKNWVTTQSFKKYQPLKLPVFAEVNRCTTKEELAGLIMNHLILGSSYRMIFLPALPMEYHSKKSLPNRLSSKQLTPVRFPVFSSN